jgi:hypothetical protein
MRSSSIALVAALLIFPASRAESAARTFSGTLAIQVATLAPIAVPGAGIAIVNGSSGSGHLTALAVPVGAFATTGFVVPITDPGAAPIVGVQVTAANGAGSFAGVGGSGSFGGVMPLAGTVKVCLFGPCSIAVANLDVPLSVVGNGGATYVTGAINLTVIGAPWTTGTASIGSITAMGGVAPASSTDFISLVTPIYIIQNVPAGSIVPSFAYLNLSGLSIPEPGTLVLLGSGIIALVVMGRSRLPR